MESKAVLLVVLCAIIFLQANSKSLEEQLLSEGYQRRDVLASSRTFIRGYEHVLQSVPDTRSEIFQSKPWRDDPLFILPVFEGTLLPDQPITWSGSCFRSNSAVLKSTTIGFSISINTTDPVSHTCYDLYLVADRENWHVTYFLMSGTHTVNYLGWGDGEQSDVQQNGVAVFLIQDGILGTLQDLWDIFNMFTGYFGKQRSIQENVAFLQQNMNVTLETRTTLQLDFPYDTVQDGDFIAMLDMNGNDPFIMYATGAMIGHTAFVMHNESGSPLICESTGVPNPPDTRVGVICTDMATWISTAVQFWCPPSQCSVALIPLNDDARAKFDSVSAWKFINASMGSPYGFETLLFAWIDTLSDNYPAPITAQLLASVFEVADHLKPDVANTFFMLALNQRLSAYFSKPPCPTFLCVLQTVGGLDQFAKMMTLPEVDSWRYNNQPAMVCSSFAVQTYRAAGIMGPQADQINGQEFTPRDVYMLNLFNTTWRNPICNVDPLPYCQLTGQYLIRLPYLNSVDPYATMNERCGSMPLLYERLPQGC